MTFVQKLFYDSLSKVQPYCLFASRTDHSARARIFRRRNVWEFGWNQDDLPAESFADGANSPSDHSLIHWEAIDAHWNDEQTAMILKGRRVSPSDSPCIEIPSLMEEVLWSRSHGVPPEEMIGDQDEFPPLFSPQFHDAIITSVPTDRIQSGFTDVAHQSVSSTPPKRSDESQITECAARNLHERS